MVQDLISFTKRSIAIMVRGDRRYYGWIAFLMFWILLGVAAWGFQLVHGLSVTNLTDQVPWGAYIANFSFTVGLASSALAVIVLAWIDKKKDLGMLVIVGQIMSIAALTMGMLFVVVDIGSPLNAWHLMPVIGRFNFPISMLSWDVVVLNGYLFTNFFLATWWVFMRFRGKDPNTGPYRPVLMTAIGWAISIHVVAAFLYAALGGRPHWNAAIVAPRVLVEAFGSGPAMFIIVLLVIRRELKAPVSDLAISRLRNLVTAAVYTNLFLFGAELFVELYASTAHASSLRYMLFGLHGHHLLVPFLWFAIFLNISAAVVLGMRRFFSRTPFLVYACVATVVGMWIEKGMGMVIPGFVPSSLGEIVEYSPSFVEFSVCAFVWALGALVLTLLLKVAVQIEYLGLRAPGVPAPTTLEVSDPITG